ncbi:MAG: GDSL-type esterase/lipase family protein, partial [Verrucomicrobiota bacterium]
MRLSSFLWALLVALAALPRLAAQEQAKIGFKDGDMILFMGDTFLEREGVYGHLETRLTFLHGDRTLKFRNLSWAADTPLGKSRASFDWNKSEQDWLRRVKEQVALVKPTVAFLSYGMTAALEGGASGTAAYQAQLGTLMDAITEVSGQPVRFVLLGPLGCEAIPGLPAEVVRRNNELLQQYSTATWELAQRRGAAFVEMFRANTGKRPQDPQWTEDGLHLNHQGYYMVAYHVQQGLGLVTLPHYPVDPYETLRRAIARKNEFFFHRWRPANWTYLFGFRKHEQGQNAGEIPRFDPLIAQWEAKIAELRNPFEQDPALVKEIIEVTRYPGGRPGATPVPAPARPQVVPTFQVADGFEATLWAENPQLNKPIQMNWDPQGRLWVASSEVYPQIRPGQPATDSIIVLSDSDGDGHADRSQVFANGLLIPTGVVPDGRDGCYLAESHQLLYLRDTNGD